MLRIFLFCVYLTTGTMGFVDIEKFFPSVQGNLTKVVWAHAVNNVTYLNKTLLNNEIMMIEADVLLGTLTTNPNIIVPVMAHPPKNVSDLSLEMFLKKIVDHNKQNHTSTNTTKKGIKLDFKEINAFTNSTSIIRSNKNEGNYPLWINADILQGPINATSVPVNGDQFLKDAKSFEGAWLSVGWTTLLKSNMTGQYRDENINEMISILKKNNITNRITFPVRAALAAESNKQMGTLLNQWRNSTLTIWSSEGDNVNIANLRTVIANVGIHKAFVDVPDDLKSKLRLNDLPKPNRALRSLATSLPIMLILLFIFL